jgi:hypothetical protein
MSNNINEIYNFVFKGLLTEESLDKAGRRISKTNDLYEKDIYKSLSIDSLDNEHVLDGQKMAVVYTAIAAFENSVRELISGILLENFKEEWWIKGVSEKVRTRAEQRMEEEKKVKWHTQRGDKPINYTTLGDLVTIIRNNWNLFEAHIQSIEWAANVFDAIERSRNVIMHSGILSKEDIERLGIYIRDWIKQVGA